MASRCIKKLANGRFLLIDISEPKYADSPRTRTLTMEELKEELLKTDPPDFVNLLMVSLEQNGTVIW